MNLLTPISSPFADLYVWKSVQQVTTAVPRATDHFQTLSDSFFCLMAFMGSTNYDNFSGEFMNPTVDSAAFNAFGPPRVPNNFAVLITYNGQIKLMPVAMPQGALCSNGYMQGAQLPYPMIFPPLTTFDFEFERRALTPLTVADVEVPVEIHFSLYGYNLPVERLEQFLLMWPSIQMRAQTTDNWGELFTAQTIPGITAPLS